MKRIFLCSLLIVLTACSGIQQLPPKPVPGSQPAAHQNAPAQVDIGLTDEIGINGGSTPQLIPNEETVRLGDRGGDIFTPVEDSATIGQGVSKKLRIGLSLGPGLYRTINYVSLLKFLERQNLNPQVITGTGFGAIVAAMYASGMTPEVIEWNFYRYFKEKRKYRPYESEWLEEVDNLLLDKLKNKTIQDTPKKFYITLYNSKTKKTYYFDKGNIRELLLLNLKLSNSVDLRKPGIQYTTAFENEVFNAGLMKRLGVDFAIGADVLGSKFDFEDSNEFLIGVFGRAAGRITREKKGFDYFYSIPLQKMSLDSTENGAFYLLKTQEYVEAQSSRLKKLIQQKISSGKAAE
ncbi:patatin-like phospholipase family protein [Bacteriovorax sp. PP10]|uniref:Patatin-like phospholipase family protein n=1 Tax=Bacteriovorax antarcticus TaxID=3088717 RepID=A0ABU5VQJ8_9BACT|nr:patatin-like phospholipase family protein [Bacteriovorax sp. PP10]MEA9354902.1 patatin-like phospholipase family protein [Bacteriovorax sp. PP10]